FPDVSAPYSGGAKPAASFASRGAFAYEKPRPSQDPPMSLLNLSIALGNYDRNRALLDGAVPTDGVHPVFMKMTPEAIFFRTFRHPLDPRRHRRDGTAGRDQRPAAAWSAARQRTRRHDDFGPSDRGRNRWLHGAAHALASCAEPSPYRLAVSGYRGGGEGLL